jgi:hypothetical protein
MHNKDGSIRVLSIWKRGVLENCVQICLLTAVGGIATGECNTQQKNREVLLTNFSSTITTKLYQ